MRNRGITALQSKHLDQLNVVSARVIENGNFYGSHFSWLYTEVNSKSGKPVKFLLSIVNIELGVRNACLEKRLLIDFGRFEMVR